MNKQESIEKTLSHLLKSLPPNLQVMQEDIEKHLRRSLQNMFAKLDLVTREEFDVQVNVLRRTREKLEALEARSIKQDKKKGNHSPES